MTETMDELLVKGLMDLGLSAMTIEKLALLANVARAAGRPHANPAETIAVAVEGYYHGITCGGPDVPEQGSAEHAQRLELGLAELDAAPVGDTKVGAVMKHIIRRELAAISGARHVH